MVGKSEIKSPPANKGKDGPPAKDEKKPDMERRDGPNKGGERGEHQQHQRGGFQNRGGPRGGERGDFEGQHVQGGGRGGRGGRGGGRGGFQGRGDRSGDREGGHRGGPGGPRGDRGGHGYQVDQPTLSLEDAMPPKDKKFTGRCRLFVGNMPTDTSEDEFKEMFQEFGEFTEVFLNPSRGFGFIRMDFRHTAEKAKNALDGQVKKGRTLRIRFASHGAALKVKYLPPHVTNELLAQAFSIFGELERSVIIVDDRGKPSGEGIVEFARKPGAQAALKRISEGVFMMGSQPRPITVEPLEQKDEDDGYPEKFLQKNADVQREREQPPRFAPAGSFEFDFGNKWKEVFMMHEEQQRNLKRQFEEAIAKLEIEQAGAMMEHQTNMLRQDLLRRQEELRRLEEMHQMELQTRMDRIQRSYEGRGGSGGVGGGRHDDERRMMMDDGRRKEIDVRRQQQEDRRQQELFQQQERAMREMQGDHNDGRNAPPMQPPPAPPAGMGLVRGRQGGKGMDGHQSMSGGSQGNHQGNFSEGQPLRQSRFDQPPGFNQGHGMTAGNGDHGEESMGGGMGGNLMSMGSRGGASMGQQESMMGQGQMQERQMQERQMQGGRQDRGDRNMRDEFFEAKRARRF